jgi:dolichyl-phosphate beta-glucosyltransferase
VEVLLLAERLGFKIEDRPVEWINSPDSRVNIIADSWRMLIDAWRIRRLVERNVSSNETSLADAAHR